MHALERAEYILGMLETSKVVLVTELSREMGVTEETVRKDLEKLEKSGKLTRVHGGAYLAEGFGGETPVSVRSRIMQEEKTVIAEKCMQLMKEKESVFLDCSTTAVHLAELLAGYDKRLTVITNSLSVAEKLEENENLRLILLGGEFNRDRKAFEGAAVTEKLKDYYINKAFISTTGVSEQAGMMDATKEEAEIRKGVLAQAECSILMADSSKIEKKSVYITGKLESLSFVVSECPIEKESEKLAKKLETLKISQIC